jgi:hypothetical protein
MRKSYSNYIYQLSYEAQCISFLSVILNFFATGKVFSKTASINQFFRLQGKNVDLKQNVLVMKLQHVFVIKIQ